MSPDEAVRITDGLQKEFARTRGHIAWEIRKAMKHGNTDALPELLRRQAQVDGAFEGFFAALERDAVEWTPTVRKRQDPARGA